MKKKKTATKGSSKHLQKERENTRRKVVQKKKSPHAPDAIVVAAAPLVLALVGACGNELRNEYGKNDASD